MDKRLVSSTSILYAVPHEFWRGEGVPHVSVGSKAPIRTSAGDFRFYPIFGHVPRGAADPKGGAVESGVPFFAQATCHHVPEVYSAVGETKTAGLLREFSERGGNPRPSSAWNERGRQCEPC